MTSASPLRAIVADLERDRELLRTTVDSVPLSLRERRPGPDRWSVADVLEHLALVEQRAATIVRDLAATAPPRLPEGGVDAARTIPLDRTPLRDRSRRVDAPAPIQPTGRWPTPADAWAALEQSRVTLLEALGAAEERDLGAVTRMHPRLGVLSGYHWIAALGGHEERHAAQIAEIAEALAGDTTPG